MSANPVGGGGEAPNSGDTYCLKWTNFTVELASGLRTLFSEREAAGADADVTLVAEGRHLHTHKWLLSLCSPYFKNMFRAHVNFRSANMAVMVSNEIQFPVLEKLVRFLYHGEVKLETNEEVTAFLKAGHLLEIEGLKGRNFTVNPEKREGRQIPPPPTRRKSTASSSVGGRLVVSIPRASSSSAAYFRPGPASLTRKFTTSAATATAPKTESPDSTTKTQQQTTKASAATPTDLEIGTPASSNSPRIGTPGPSTASNFGTPAPSTASNFGTPAPSTASNIGTPAPSTASNIGTPAPSTASNIGTPAPSTGSNIGTPPSSVVTAISAPSAASTLAQRREALRQLVISGFKRLRERDQMLNGGRSSDNTTSTSSVSSNNPNAEVGGSNAERKGPEVATASSNETTQRDPQPPAVAASGGENVDSVEGGIVELLPIKQEPEEVVRKKCFFIDSSTDEEDEEGCVNTSNKKGMKENAATAPGRMAKRTRTAAAAAKEPKPGPSSASDAPPAKRPRGRPPMPKRIPPWFSNSYGELHMLEALDAFMKTKKCSTCVRRFPFTKPEQFCRHLSTHFEPNLKCPICGTAVAHYDFLRQHMKSQHNLK